MADILEANKRDCSPQSPSFAITNITEDFALDCNAEAGCTSLADVVGTLIRELIRRGLIHGTIA